MRARGLLFSLLVVGIFGCSTRPATATAPAPEHAALSVELSPPRDVTIVFDDGRSRRVAQAKTILGEALHHDADSLVLSVTAVHTANGRENFSQAIIRFSPSPTEGVTILNSKPGATNVLGALALPALVGLAVWFAASITT